MNEALYQPDAEAFEELAAVHRVVPVWREVLADLLTPLAVYDRVRDVAGPTFLLESVEQGERWGRWSFIGLDPFLEVRSRSGAVHLEGWAPAPARDAAAAGDVLAVLDALLDALQPPQLEGLPPLFAGAVGYLGWDVVRGIEHLPSAPPDDLGADDVRLVLPRHVIAVDHLRQRLVVITNVVLADGEDAGRRHREAIAASERLVERLAAPVRAAVAPPPAAERVDDAAANMPAAHFLRAVEVAKEHIRAGDVFQVVPSQRFSLETTVSALAVYRVLRVINPSPYMYLFEWDDQQVVGSSPEALVTVRGRTASIWPIAGSRPRGETDAEDRTFEDDLRADDKERAEHIMLVDLARNDLGRVCELGSVVVDELMSVVRYSHVMHLVSTVSGEVRAGVSAVDVLRATFPAGTLSGAPKVRAMQIIDELEPTRRGLYGGGIGYLDLAGDVDLCIAIRTVLLRAGRAHVQAGAGVVADSQPQREFEETQNKAMALLAAVRAAEALQERSR